jgi:hypothetical protein
MTRILIALAILLGIVTAPAAQEMKLVERATTDATHRVGPKDDNLADILTFANEVFDAADKTKKGTDQGYCIRVVVAKAFECTWTLTLPEGQIMVEGPFFDDADSVLAITGGTGRYAGARGEMKLHARDAKGSEYDFTYILHHTSPP